MPSPLPRQDRWNGFAHYGSIDFGLPQITVGSAPALSVSWPAQRSLTLQPADSPSRLMRPSTPEAPAALLPPPPLRLLPGGAIQFPGGFISRCGPAPFTAHCKRLIASTICYPDIADTTLVRMTRSPMTRSFKVVFALSLLILLGVATIAVHRHRVGQAIAIAQLYEAFAPYRQTLRAFPPRFSVKLLMRILEL